MSVHPNAPMTPQEAYSLWASLRLAEVARIELLPEIEAAMDYFQVAWTAPRGKGKRVDPRHLRRWRDLQALRERILWARDTQKWTEPQTEAPPVAEDAG